MTFKASNRFGYRWIWVSIDCPGQKTGAIYKHAPAVEVLLKTTHFHDIIDNSMKRKKLQKKIETLREQIIEHKEKIALERQKSFPNEGCIIHWEKEIRAFENQIAKAIKKLEG